LSAIRYERKFSGSEIASSFKIFPPENEKPTHELARHADGVRMCVTGESAWTVHEHGMGNRRLNAIPVAKFTHRRAHTTSSDTDGYVV
jgi:hypothetical protein